MPKATLRSVPVRGKTDRELHGTMRHPIRQACDETLQVTYPIAPASKRLAAFLIHVLVVLSLLGGPAMAIEEPAYEVVKTYPEFELRRYAPYLVAETEVRGDFDEVGNRAFRILAGYIFGDNRSREKMEMTAPVNQRPVSAEGEKLEMTAPVSQRRSAGAGAGAYVFSFVMPSGYTLETLPEPLDPRVRLRQEPARLMAVHGYSGRWTESNYRQSEAILLAAVERAGLKPLAAPVYARYNSPFSLWFMRRNEVMVEVSAPD
jgi:hypothetical protein